MVIFQPKTTLKLALQSVNSFDAKNNEKRVIFTTSKTALESTRGRVNLFYAKPMKTRLYSLQPSRKNATDFFFFFFFENCNFLLLSLRKGVKTMGRK